MNSKRHDKDKYLAARSHLRAASPAFDEFEDEKDFIGEAEPVGEKDFVGETKNGHPHVDEGIPSEKMNGDGTGRGRLYVDGKTVKYEYFHSRYKGMFAPDNLTCDLCGEETFSTLPVCKACFEKMPKNDLYHCPTCGRPTYVKDKVCEQCLEHTPRLRFSVSPLKYARESRHLVYEYKNGMPHLKEFFCDLLTASIVGMERADVICYVPMTFGEYIVRGYNQSKLLADGVAKRLGLPVVKALKKVRHTKPQKTLSYSLRAENLQGAFCVIDETAIKGKRVLLIDDIMTTTATADEISGELLKAGAEYVLFAAIAATADIDKKVNTISHLDEN